ncbi:MULTISPECIES: phosphate signaling complex protein PhoU [Paraclostridium]|uniref:Phosphate-specific transport system accessory protein PhoU n=1 Tax=Paraclostridium benzoelyticum TaxID=1629550 RepID=A0A0M3DDK4_9FIRM|nr:MULTISPECIES: phosphate signaling complex protein PhoU [Paraclostridium]KKY00745.1 PhoU family transcriptional regulator [Paraclostridium benzoelyticum]MCU9814838.1 phosphate signaling complex protein PhoU [Paraclostridium sp. AKS73]MDM8127360.1 phosphate signaling complex protein PhoU [Paraclostridium benzoelyticum]
MVNNNLELNINTLINYTLKMFDKSQEILEDSVNSMITKDVKKAKGISEKDDEIDTLRDYIRDRSIELMALKQPMAKDLRFIYALESICLELERIGDYSVNISVEVIKIGKEEYIKELIDIPKMKDICIDMIKDAKRALEQRDEELAYNTALKDDLVDKLYDVIYEHTLKVMHEKEVNIDQGVTMLFVARYLERIGDHITNICEKIIYALRGDMIEIG